MTLERTAILPKLREIFAEHLHVELPPDEAGLISGGFVDSLALVELLLQIEQEFGVSPDFEQLELEDFESLAAVEQLVVRSMPPADDHSEIDPAGAVGG
jgi:acyl carrier protein